MPDVPIPARLANRPVQHGLVVPYISVQTADGRAYLGDVHTRKLTECLMWHRCQACGEKLGQPMVILATEDGMARRYSSEPPLHPECAAYSQRACPMLNGRMAHHKTAPGRHIGQPCDTPGCDCDGWVTTGEVGERGGPAKSWFAVWVNDYAIAVNSDGRPHGVMWTVEPLRVRPVRQLVAAEPDQQPSTDH